MKDLKKVEFDFENYETGINEDDPAHQQEILTSKITRGFMNYPCGYYVLPNNMPVLFINAGGDWETPICFAIYFDGKKLRGYIPKAGNIWNRKNKSAFGNDEDEDVAGNVALLEEAQDWMAPEMFQQYMKAGTESHDFHEDCSSKEAIFKDVMERIVIAKGDEIIEDEKPVEKKEKKKFEPTGHKRIELTKSTLFTIYVAAFNHGANEGAFPEHGTMEAFNKLLNGEPYLGDGTRYDIVDKIKYLD